MSRSKTTSIPRPKQPPVASDAGRSRLGDFTRPIPVDKRIVRRPRWTVIAAAFAVLTVAAIAVAVFVVPIRTWMGQGDDLVQREAELSELQRVNSQLAGEVARLRTDDGVREAAREEIGFIEQGTERLTVLPLPDLTRNLPDGWPYNVVTAILDVRTAESAADAAD